MTARGVETPEESFGRMVAFTRERKGLSQRELAERLAAVGMKVDGPAVSRLEKGTRALKLAEAYKVAEALDVSLQLLLSVAQTPASDFLHIREGLENAYGVFVDSANAFLEALAEGEKVLRRNPELLDTMPEAGFGVDNFPEWWVNRASAEVPEYRAGEKSPVDYLWVGTEAEKARYLGLLLESYKNWVKIGEHPFEGRG